ncbi:hypothetical protein L0337_40325 [candidate division KSB1 bacterium]|nr:hypothetical protein [candidate division KSB1 bacterium]
MDKGRPEGTTRYADIFSVMREMHWSWADVCVTPFDLVEEAAERLSAEHHWEKERRKVEQARAEQKKGKRRG